MKLLKIGLAAMLCAWVIAGCSEPDPTPTPVPPTPTPHDGQKDTWKFLMTQDFNESVRERTIELVCVAPDSTSAVLVSVRRVNKDGGVVNLGRSVLTEEGLAYARESLCNALPTPTPTPLPTATATPTVKRVATPFPTPRPYRRTPTRTPTPTATPIPPASSLAPVSQDYIEPHYVSEAVMAAGVTPGGDVNDTAETRASKQVELFDRELWGDEIDNLRALIVETTTLDFIERCIPNRYSTETLAKIQERYPDAQFGYDQTSSKHYYRPLGYGRGRNYHYEYFDRLTLTREVETFYYYIDGNDHKQWIDSETTIDFHTCNVIDMSFRKVGRNPELWSQRRGQCNLKQYEKRITQSLHKQCYDQGRTLFKMLPNYDVKEVKPPEHAR